MKTSEEAYIPTAKERKSEGNFALLLNTKNTKGRRAWICVAPSTQRLQPDAQVWTNSPQIFEKVLSCCGILPTHVIECCKPLHT